MSDGDLMTAAADSYAGGRLEETLATLERAHADAAAAGDPLAAASAATRLAIHCIIDTGLMAPTRAWLGRAERLLEGHQEGPVHAWLAAGRACERWMSGDHEAARGWAERAVGAGERHGEAGAANIGRVSLARSLIASGAIDDGLAVLDDAAGRLLSEDIDPLTAGCLYCEMVCIWQGLARYDKADEWTEAMEHFCRDHAVGSINGRCLVHKAEMLRIQGRIDDAERTVVRACEELRPYMRSEFGWPLTELGHVRLARGDLDSAEQAFVEARRVGWDPQPGLARLLLERGETEAALTSISDALLNPLPVPSKELPPNTDLRRARLLSAAVEIACAAGDVPFADSCAQELRRIVSTYGGSALQATARTAEGRVRLASGDSSGARVALHEAVSLWTVIGALQEAAAARAALAAAYRAEGNERAAAFEEQALLPAAASVQPAGRCLFRRDGDFWTIAFSGRSVLMKDLRGLQHLASLLGRAGREIHVTDLAGSGGTLAGGDAGPALDAQAKEVYRRRLREIEEDIEEARNFGDDARAARSEVEREFLVQELSRAVGLGGRDRPVGAASERARAAVTRAIRNAMSRISAEHPELGEHLERTVRTGTYCAYLPDPAAGIQWVL